MPDASLPDTTVLTEAYWDPYVREQLVTTCTSGTRPSGVEGRVIVETDTNLVLVYDGSGWVQMGNYGAWTSHTPQVDQGASTNIAKTVNYSKYATAGKQIVWSFTLSLTAGGSAGSGVTLTLPVTAASSNGLRGTGLILDSSTQMNYVSVLAGASTTKVSFVADQTGTNAAWGASPNLALASGDVLSGSITYEAAS